MQRVWKPIPPEQPPPPPHENPHWRETLPVPGMRLEVSEYGGYSWTHAHPRGSKAYPVPTLPVQVSAEQWLELPLTGTPQREVLPVSRV